MSLLRNDCLNFANSPTAAYVGRSSLFHHQPLLVENPVSVRNALSYYSYITFRATSLGKNIAEYTVFVVFLSGIDTFHRWYTALTVSNLPQLFFTSSCPVLSFVSLLHKSELLVLIILAICSQLPFLVKTEAKQTGFDGGSFLYFFLYYTFLFTSN